MQNNFKRKAPIILVDCDEVLVEAAIDWVAHLNNLAGTNYTLDELGNDYNLGTFFKETHGIENPMDFWHCANLYDKRTPKPFAVDGLRYLKDRGYEIFVVTYCVGNHYRSKEDFIERWFGDTVSGMIATGHKYMVKGDMIIDDRDDHLMSFDDSVFKVRMNTPYKQKVDFTPHAEMNSWKDIARIVEELEEHRMRIYVP